MDSRDSLFGTFDANWADFAWELSQASTPETVATAVSPLLDRCRLVRDLLSHRTPLTKQTGKLVTLRRRVSQASDDQFRARKNADAQSERAQEAKHALREANEKLKGARHAKERLWLARLREIASRERKKRRQAAQEAQRIFQEAEKNCRSLESELRDQEAIFTQQELLRFIHSNRYEFTPHNLANALAGLPYLGWRQSFRRCQKMPCNMATSKYYEVFLRVWKLLDKTQPKSADKLIEQFLYALASHTTKPDYIRDYFVENWAYLKLAIHGCWKSSAPPLARPFTITSDFLARIGGPTTALARIALEDQRLEIDKLAEALKTSPSPRRRRNRGARRRRNSSIQPA